jgi:hypothetical protein
VGNSRLAEELLASQGLLQGKVVNFVAGNGEIRQITYESIRQLTNLNLKILTQSAKPSFGYDQENTIDWKNQGCNASNSF